MRLEYYADRINKQEKSFFNQDITSPVGGAIRSTTSHRGLGRHSGPPNGRIALVVMGALVCESETSLSERRSMIRRRWTWSIINSDVTFDS